MKPHCHIFFRCLCFVLVCLLLPSCRAEFDIFPEKGYDKEREIEEIRQWVMERYPEQILIRSQGSSDMKMILTPHWDRAVSNTHEKIKTVQVPMYPPQRSKSFRYIHPACQMQTGNSDYQRYVSHLVIEDYGIVK